MSEVAEKKQGKLNTLLNEKSGKMTLQIVLSDLFFIFKIIIHNSSKYNAMILSGTTGAAVLGLGLGAAAVSKEIIVLDADVLAGGFLAGVSYVLVKKAGPSVIEALDNRAKGIHTTMSEGKMEHFET